MQLKNLNPYTGLKQVSSGYLCLPRPFVLNHIKGHLKLNEMGYFILFLTSADWDNDKYRHGYIRHSLKDLSIMWGISLSTLTQNCNKLTEKGLIIKKDGILIIKDFSQFTPQEAQQRAKNKPSNAEIQTLFPEIFIKHNEKSRINQIKASHSFRSSSKV